MLSQPDIIDLTPRKEYSCSSGMELSAGMQNEKCGGASRPFAPTGWGVCRRPPPTAERLPG